MNMKIKRLILPILLVLAVLAASGAVFLVARNLSENQKPLLALITDSTFPGHHDELYRSEITGLLESRGWRFDSLFIPNDTVSSTESLVEAIVSYNNTNYPTVLVFSPLITKLLEWDEELTYIDFSNSRVVPLLIGLCGVDRSGLFDYVYGMPTANECWAMVADYLNSLDPIPKVAVLYDAFSNEPPQGETAAFVSAFRGESVLIPRDRQRGRTDAENSAYAETVKTRMAEESLEVAVMASVSGFPALVAAETGLKYLVDESYALLVPADQLYAVIGTDLLTVADTNTLSIGLPKERGRTLSLPLPMIVR